MSDCAAYVARECGCLVDVRVVHELDVAADVAEDLTPCADDMSGVDGRDTVALGLEIERAQLVHAVLHKGRHLG